MNKKIVSNKVSNQYLKPQIQVFTLEVEQGFAASFTEDPGTGQPDPFSVYPDYNDWVWKN